MRTRNLPGVEATFDIDQAELFPNIEQKHRKRSAFGEMYRAIKEHGTLCPPTMVAAALGLSRQRVHVLVNQGRIATVEINGRRWVPLAALEVFMTEERRVGRAADYPVPESFGAMWSQYRK